MDLIVRLNIEIFYFSHQSFKFGGYLGVWKLIT